MTDHQPVIALTGATGFVGRAVVRALLASGRSVRAFVRDSAKARAVLPADRRVSTVVGSATDPAALRDLVRGSAAVINLIGILREGAGQTFASCHVEAPRRLVDACAHAGVRRFVHMSALGADPNGPAAYQRSKFEGESIVRKSDLAWTVFRPGLIHGPDGDLIGMIRDWARGVKQPFFFMPYFARVRREFTDALLPTVHWDAPQVAPVSVHDVARAFVASLDCPAAMGEVYNLVGGESLSFVQMLEWWRDNLPRGDQSLPILPVPGEAAALQAKAAKLLGLGALLPFDEGMPLMASQDTTADLTKVRADLGLDPAPFRASAGAYVASIA